MAFRKNDTYKYQQGKTFKISRSGIDSYLNCKKCFYLNKVKNIKDIGIPGFLLNSAVDELLKKEFDVHREDKTPHRLMGKNMIPYQHEDLEKWRNNFEGISYHHKETDLIITGAIDDVWINKDTNELVIVEYKSTSTQEKIYPKSWWINSKDLPSEWLENENKNFICPICKSKVFDNRNDKASAKSPDFKCSNNKNCGGIRNFGQYEVSLDDKWKDGYKKQIEIYQWLFKMNNFKVSKDSYFVYANGLKSEDKFNDKLCFDTRAMIYRGSTDWVEKTIFEIKTLLEQNTIPQNNPECDTCSYVESVNSL